PTSSRLGSTTFGPSKALVPPTEVGPIMIHLRYHQSESIIIKGNSCTFMDEDTTKNLAYIISIVIFVLMAKFVLRKGLENRSRILKDNAPKIAGDDELGGGAKNPQQFDEPDDKALDEMAKLLGEEE
ncbi:MAG: hypothetical protein ACKVLG_05165, partial [Fidelibacterota bacterium]